MWAPLLKLFLDLQIKNKYKNTVFASVFTKIEINSKNSLTRTKTRENSSGLG